MKEESASLGLQAWPINSIDELMERAKSTQEQQKQFSKMTVKQRAESEQLQSGLTKLIDDDLCIVRKQENEIIQKTLQAIHLLSGGRDSVVTAKEQSVATQIDQALNPTELSNRNQSVIKLLRDSLQMISQGQPKQQPRPDLDKKLSEDPEVMKSLTLVAADLQAKIEETAKMLQAIEK